MKTVVAGRRLFLTNELGLILFGLLFLTFHVSFVSAVKSLGIGVKRFLPVWRHPETWGSRTVRPLIHILNIVRRSGLRGGLRFRVLLMMSQCGFARVVLTILLLGRRLQGGRCLTGSGWFDRTTRRR